MPCSDRFPEMGLCKTYLVVYLWLFQGLWQPYPLISGQTLPPLKSQGAEQFFLMNSLNCVIVNTNIDTKDYQTIPKGRFSNLSIKDTKNYILANELKEIVSEIQFRLKLSQDEIAQRIGYSRPHLTKAINNNLGGKILETLKREFQDILQYVPGATPLPVVTDNQETYLQTRRGIKQKDGPHMVPLVPVDAQAGYSKSYNNTDFLNKLEYYPIVPGVDPHGAIWRYFQVKGDSMLDFLHDGDYVLASQQPKEDWPDLKDYLVYVIVTEDLVTIKHVVKRKDQLILIPRNEKQKQIAVNVAEIKEIWKYRRHIGWNASSPKKLEIKI